jgi:glycosyltransferase involved in cell wall biosynthesis
MKSQTPKIVVITPVKNEEWILDRFLAVTSQFADHIIIADQNSTDESLAICKNYPKVILIENKSDQFNEGERQILLIQKARELVPEPKIILALDADEMLAANATKTLGWKLMLKAKPGTVLCFEKLNLYLDTYACIRYDTSPIGYVDDGAEHKPRPIHSIRIPAPDYATRLCINDVKILHYGLIRPTAKVSKTRMYSVVENVLGTSNVLSRRLSYASKNSNEELKLELANIEWFTAWEEIGIDMHTIPNQKYYWYDFEVLKYFHKYGWRHFWLEDIWGFNWEACRLYAKSIGMSNIPEHPIPEQPRIIDILARNFTVFYGYLRQILKSNYKSRFFWN